MSSSSQLPTFVSRTARIAAWTGILLGLAFGFYGGDGFTISLLKAALLGLSFAWLARRLAITILRAWLETKLETMTKERDELMKKEDEEAEAKKKKKAEAKKP